jgi:hypothetical protein
MIRKNVNWSLGVEERREEEAYNRIETERERGVWCVTGNRKRWMTIRER